MEQVPGGDPPRLHRALGLVQLTASGVGLIVGAGIYVLLADMAEEAGAAVWAAFALAGVLSGLTALSYAELVGMYPRASAEHEYVRHVAPPWAAFLTGWMMLAGLVVAAGAVALGPGLGRHPDTAGFLDALLPLPCPTVLDADALYFLADDPSLSWLALPAVMTPPSPITGFRLASPSSVVSGRLQSSFVAVTSL